MKKYWKAIAVLVSIVLSIGIFYVNSAISAENHPQFAIQTLSGDAQEVKPLVLEGAYSISSSADYISTDIKITEQGASYNNRYSFFDRISGIPTEIKELQEQYRTFMRGKQSSIHQYFEDNEFLAYANVDQKISSLGTNNFKFEISMLNKADDKVNSFTIKVPDEGKLDYVSVEDVQLIEDKMYVVTQNMESNNSDFNDEKHIYEIDIISQKITSHKALLKSTQSNEDFYTSIEIVENSPTAPKENIILLKTEETMVRETESMRPIDFKQEIMSYNLATQEIESVNVPGLNLEENRLSFVEGSTVYFTRVENQEMIITSYRLGENQVDQDYRIQLQAKVENESLQLDPFQVPMISIKEGKIYIVSQEWDSNSNGDVAVVDMETGEALYSGQIALETSSEVQEKFELYITGIYVK